MECQFFRALRSWQHALPIAYLLIVAQNILYGAPLQLVVPNGYDNIEAAGSGGWPQRIRAQYIYAENQFESLPADGAYLTSIRWRPNGATTSAANWSVDELTISASVTATAPAAMGMTYLDNMTAPATVVRVTAPWHGGTENVGAAEGPKAFDIEFQLDVPFYYKPADGNLLLDIVAQGPNAAPILLDRLGDTDRANAAVIVAWNWPVESGVPSVANTGGYVGGIVANFTFAPLPGDFDGDGDVDGADFLVWQRNPSVGSLSDWQVNYGTPIPLWENSVAVAEPATVLLVAVAGLGLAALRRRRTDYFVRCLIVIAAAGSLLAENAIAQTVNLPGWRLVWQDEFDAAGVDTSKWQVLTRQNSYNEEKQYYLPQQASIVDGNLRITATDEPIGNKQYRSARLESWQSFGPGRFEARIDLPTGQGMWPAFWLFPNDPRIPWPTGGEIDILENRGSQPELVGSAYHWQATPGPCCDYARYVFGEYAAFGALGPVNFHEGFHIYSAEWSEHAIRFFVDGELSFIVTETMSRPVFETPKNIIVNLAVGGLFGGDPDLTTVFPQVMDIDYVRVWEAVPEPSGSILLGLSLLAITRHYRLPRA